MAIFYKGINIAIQTRRIITREVFFATFGTTQDENQSFVVDYGWKIELPVHNKEQPCCTYYFSPMSIYNLGVVNHAHVYDDGWVSEHLHCHVYTEGIGKKGANNVALLIMKTL
jgi:hypothetical protein